MEPWTHFLNICGLFLNIKIKTIGQISRNGNGNRQRGQKKNR
jgi:hypothetical protein